MHSITEQLVNGLVQAYEEIAKLLTDFDLLNKKHKMHYDKDYGAYFDYGNHTEKVITTYMLVTLALRLQMLCCLQLCFVVSAFARCSDVRIMWDQNTDAQSAINDVIRKWLGSRQICCNWATKGAATSDEKQGSDSKTVQNNLFKTREEKYRSRIRVLEALANGTVESQRITRQSATGSGRRPLRELVLTNFRLELPTKFRQTLSVAVSDRIPAETDYRP
ncbi:hypothetical protein Tco_0928845 [Tanacetum coccineum]